MVKDMKSLKKYVLYLLLGTSVFLQSCEKFFNPDLGIVVDEKDYFQDWNEFRSAEMGLYALQQNLVEQIVVLGELRADLLEPTDQADGDLLEIYNFNVSSSNKYASPVNFYKLIGACNSLQTQLEEKHPKVLDKEAEITSYDRLYGEVLCMKAWAYFNAARIYGKVPFIYPSLSGIDEIKEYVNSEGTYVDSLHIIYGQDGFHNDTIRNETIVLEKKYFDLNRVINVFTDELETKVKAVGVIHNMNFNDVTWDVTVWNQYALHALLGQMYLFDQNYGQALNHFDHIVYNYDSENNYIRFGIDSKFAFSQWKNIFSQIDPYEHIFTLWFNKSAQQTNGLQDLFSEVPPNRYMLKPTKKAVQYWENMWDGMVIKYDKDHPERTALAIDMRTKKPKRGIPGDFFRGYGVSYGYVRNEKLLEEDEIQKMLEDKADGNSQLVKNVMEDVDTVVYKYTIGKNPYDHDANFILFRAANIHLYYAEILVWRVYMDGDLESRQVLKSLNFVNNGIYNNDPRQKGIRGRVGFTDGDEALSVSNVVYEHDPINNNIIGYKNLNSLDEKQRYLEELILEERARELAFEGERFYDLMRIANRRGEPSFLADIVASKFSGSKREQIRSYLMNPENWYIPLVEP